MQRRRWLVNTLLALAALGIGLALWLTRQSPAPPPVATPVIATPASELRRIVVRHASTQITLEREHAGQPWQMVAPRKARPDPVHIASLLQLASATAQHRYALGSIPDATTGLGQSALVLGVNHQAPVRLGGAGPTAGSRYVATPHAVLLVDLPELGHLDGDWTDWVDPRLVAPGAQLTRLVLPDFTLTLDNNQQWQASPVGQRSRDAAQTTVATWQRAKALAVVPANHKRERIARITLGFVDAPTRHLDVIERQPNLILRDPQLDVDYHLAGNRVAPLLDLEHPGIATP